MQSPLPDFYIGAHAAIAGLVLLTRDATRSRTYFPALEIIAPRSGDRRAERTLDPLCGFPCGFAVDHHRHAEVL